jgi:SAM-dependent methyltransferase
MSLDDRERWDAKYAAKSVPEKLAPDDWLVEQAAPLPRGRALELACGLGHNAIWLAGQGWRVDAVDVSPIGLRLAAELAARNGATVNWIVADLDEYIPAANNYDLIVVFRFLDRTRLPAVIERSLKSGGRLIYETFTQSHLTRPDNHLKNPAFALAPGELPRLFPNLSVVSYSECELPDRSVARFVAEKLADAG